MKKDRQKQDKQAGFIILMGMLSLVLGAAVWFGTLGNVQSNTMEISHNNAHIAQLQQLKQKMLAYASLHPELYEDATNVPGVGYLPCPDTSGDGNANTNCDVNGAGTNRLFVLGKVPYKIATRYFSFLDSQTDNSQYWYAVDARFVNSSARYATSSSQRYSPLNNTLSNEVVDKDGATVYPLTLDGKEDIVMVLFYAGSALGGQSRPSNDYTDYLEQPTVTEGSTVDFKSVGLNGDVFNDYVIAITRKEWESAVLSRVSQDISPEDTIPDLCANVAATDVSWFNDCTYTGTNIPPFACTNIVVGSENITGQGWRTIICP